MRGKTAALAARCLSRGSSSRTIAAPATMASILTEGHIARPVLEPAVGRHDDALSGHVRQGASDALRHRLGRLDLMSERSRTPSRIVLLGSFCSTEQSRLACAVSMEICCRVLELRQEGIAGRALVDDGGVAEADVDGGRARSRRRAPGRAPDAPCSRLVGAGLHVGLVDLHDVGAGREEVLDLGVDGGGVVQAERHLVLVVVVLRLLVMVKGPGTVILIMRSVLARRNCTSRTSTGCRRLIGPATRGTGLGWPLRSSAVPGLSMSTPSSAVAKRLE